MKYKQSLPVIFKRKMRNLGRFEKFSYKRLYLPSFFKELKPKDYIIEFTKLCKGENEFTFVIDDKFLAGIDGEHPQHANAKVQMQLMKSETFYDLNFEFSGTVELSCDVCLDEFDMPLKGKFHLIMKISDVENYSDDEIIYITPKLIEYDLTQYLYECFMLSLPIKRVCNLGGKDCNPEVLKKLDEMKNMNSKTENEDDVDPRWNNLKGIFNN